MRGWWEREGRTKIRGFCLELPRFLNRPFRNVDRFLGSRIRGGHTKEEGHQETGREKGMMH